MRANRIVRVILGLLCLAIFLGYALIRASYSPMSEDFTGGDWATYLRENYGLNPDGTPVEGYVPAVTEEPQIAPAEQALPAEPKLEAAPVETVPDAGAHGGSG